jgi:ferredoxin-NADP reductase
VSIPPDGELAVRSPPRWQTAEVVEVVQEAPDAVTLRLALEVETEFLPGQYYNIRLATAGRTRPVQRAYSIASSPVPDASVIDLGVREVPDGLVSPRLVRDLSAGDRVEVRGPAGRFTWTEQDGGPVLLVGAGSGVVPLVSGLHVPMCLVCSSASFEDALYHDDLERLVEECSWLQVVHSFTQDPNDPRGAYHRRIDRALLAEVLHGQTPRCAYLCGPPAMVENVAGWLGEFGLDSSRVHTEKYD